MQNEVVRRSSPSRTWVEPPREFFPLLLNPFELYYLEEDRPGYPSVFPIRIQCGGWLDKDLFEQAHQLAHARHPLLSARIKGRDEKQPRWVGGKPAPIRWYQDQEPVEKQISFRALQVAVQQSGTKTIVELMFHHTAVDGLGAFQFVRDLMLAYAHLCTGEAGPPPWHRLEPERLLARDGYRLRWQEFKAIDLLRFAQVLLPLVRRNAVVVSERKEPLQPESISAADSRYLVHHLSEEETASLARVASLQSVMLNDLMVRDLFLTLQHWNTGSGDRRPIRVLVPTNMRRREDYRMPAANAFSFAFLTRRAKVSVDRRRLLESIRDEMAEIKQNKRGLYYEAGLRVFCRFPRLMRWVLNRPRSFATAVFSNLGTGFDHVPLPWRDGCRIAGDLVLEMGCGAPPIRPETRVGFAVHTYAGKMAICLRCDPHWFDAQGRQAMLDAFVHQLRLTIQTGT